MINLLCTFCHDDHPICLSQEFFLDLAWWQEFFQSWNCCSFLQYPVGSTARLQGFFRCLWGSWLWSSFPGSRWFSGAWLPTQVSQSIEYKEFFPIIVAAYLWSLLWASKRVTFLLDNRSVVEILCLTLQEPLPSCPRFAVCPCWQLVLPCLSLPPQLEGSLT